MNKALDGKNTGRQMAPWPPKNPKPENEKNEKIKYERVKKGQKQSKMVKRSSSRVKFKKLSRFVRTFQYETAQNFDKVSVKTPKT